MTNPRRTVVAGLIILTGVGASLAAGRLGAGSAPADRSSAQLAALLDRGPGTVVVDAAGRTLTDKKGRPLRLAADGKTLVDAKGRVLRDKRGRALTIDRAKLPVATRPRRRTTKKQHAGTTAPGKPTNTKAGGAKDPIVVGVAYDDAQRLNEVYARYGGSAKASDGGIVAKAVADEINRTGGVGGRRLELRLREFDSTDGRPYDATWAEVCQFFAEGPRPAVVLAVQKDDELAPCFTSKGLVLVNDWPAVASTSFMARFPDTFFTPASLAMDRFADPYVQGLLDQGFFAGQVKVGLIRYGSADFDYVADHALKPALASAGIKLAAEDVVPVTHSVNDLAGFLSKIAGAVLRFRSLGVNRVLSIDDGGQVLGIFAQASGPQGYYPRLGLSSLDAPLFIQASLGPRPLRDAVGIGWSPITDVADPQDPGTNAGLRAQCNEIFRRAGIQALGNRTPYGQFAAHARCSGLLMLQKALAGRDVSTPAGVRAALESVGTAMPSGVTFSTQLNGSRHDGAIGYRYLRFEGGCSCFTYSGPVRSIG